jgi:hypothetical protein
MLNWITANWKTSLTGIVTIATVVIGTWLPQYGPDLAKVLGVLTGIGLLAAKDGNVSNSGIPVAATTVPSK